MPARQIAEMTPEQQAAAALKQELAVRSQKPEYSTRVIDLFERLAGDRFLEVGQKAMELVADGRSIERAMADALDSLKNENIVKMGRKAGR